MRVYTVAMRRDEELDLMRECMSLIRAKKAYSVGEETLIPVQDYLDQDRFEAEVAMIRRALNIVSHASEVPTAGDFITKDVVGTPVLIVRQEDGGVKAFVNVCRHRGATVELRSSGQCRRFVCPYHGWTYERDGALAAVRHADGFPSLDVATTSLVELHCMEAGGLLWVCPDPDAPEPNMDEGTRVILDELEWLGCADSVVFESDTRLWNANWKLIVDGGLESYHFKIAHRNTIAGFFADNVSTFRYFGAHVRSVLPRLSLMELDGRPESEWNIRQHAHLLYSIAPNASILAQERHVDLILSDPVAVDKTRLELMTVARVPGPNGFSDKAAAFLAANHAFTKQTLDEDFVLAEQIQRGAATGANEHFRFARFEGALTEWHRRLAERLSS
jgi:phenylpropionate dioxygenase-like ring-hydroxylating dioxygenase large terminal subunit